MNDKELADAVVALGVITRDAFRHNMYSLQSTDGQFVGVRYEAKEIVRDWRVAGALMEKMSTSDICHSIGADRWNVDDDYEWLQDPRAVIEACVEALLQNLGQG